METRAMRQMITIRPISGKGTGDHEVASSSAALGVRNNKALVSSRGRGSTSGYVQHTYGRAAVIHRRAPAKVAYAARDFYV